MAHFAQVISGVVQQVIVVRNEECLDADGNESEAVGQQFCAALFGTDPAMWVQCSYNANVNGYRGCYPGTGFTWDGVNFNPPVTA